MTPDLALLDRFAGTYAVRGGGVGVTDYNGTMQLLRHGAFLHAELKLENGEVRHGLAMPWAGRLVLAYGPKDKVEIGAYRIEGDQLTGLWVPPGAAGADYAECGHEHSTRGAGDIWTITQAHAIDQAPYSGSLQVTPLEVLSGSAPAAVKIEWHLHDGNYSSFGLKFAEAMYTTFSFEPEKPYGVAVYEQAGDELAGTWIDSNGQRVGMETLQRAT
jgi:hypothetical protein